jgi:hypothetical protein
MTTTKTPPITKKLPVLESITIDGLCCSTQVPLPPHITKVSFNNKSYYKGTYKDGTVHIMVGAGHDNNHPSPIDPDPNMHVLGMAMLHYSDPNIVGAAFSQSYSFKAGLKNFGKIGEKATMTDLTQLHNYTTYHPVHVSSISPEDHWKALFSLMKIIKKRDDQVHARACTDGSRECLEPGYKKEDGTSPTVVTNSILIFAAIDAHEGCDIATMKIFPVHS